MDIADLLQDPDSALAEFPRRDRARDGCHSLLDTDNQVEGDEFPVPLQGRAGVEFSFEVARFLAAHRRLGPRTNSKQERDKESGANACKSRQVSAGGTTAATDRHCHALPD